MPKMKSLNLCQTKIFYLSILFCFALLTNSAYCQIDINFAPEKLGRDKNTFGPADDITMMWSLDTPKDMKSYKVSYYPMLKNINGKDERGTEIWIQDFPYIPVETNSGSKNLGKLGIGTYLGWISTEPGNPAIPPDSYSEEFYVVLPEHIKIIKFNDKNSNGIMDDESIIPGWHFRIGKNGEAFSEYTTNDNGEVVIPDSGIGEFIVEEDSRDGWINTTPSRQIIRVEKNKEGYAEFGNTRLGYLKVTKYADLNNNQSIDGADYPVPGWEFHVAGDGFNQSVVTGDNGTVTLPLKPGRYIITESQRECWIPSTGTTRQVTVGPGEITSVEFGNQPRAELTIIGFNDSNRNGIRESGEDGIEGLVFTVTGPQGSRNITSKSDGKAVSSDVSGTYKVIFGPPAGLELTSEQLGPINLNVCEKVLKEIGVRIVRPPEISDLIPENNAHIGSNDVLFSWTTSEESTGDVYIKPENEPDFELVKGIKDVYHSVNVPNLTRNTWYSFYAKSAIGQMETTEPRQGYRRLYIGNGVIFTNRTYECTIERNYDQRCLVSIINEDSIAHDIQVNVSNEYSDIYLGFLESGSQDEIIRLQPGETRDLQLVIHAQDAKLWNYSIVANLLDLGPDEITDFAQIKVKIINKPINFDFEEVRTDPISLTKTFRITNLGDNVTDLSITPDNNLERDVIIQPLIRHYPLGFGEVIEFNVSPIWWRDIGSIKGNLIASAANVSKVREVNFSCMEGKQLYPVTLRHPILCFDLQGSYCINARHIDDIFNLPPGITAQDMASARLSMDLYSYDPVNQKPYNIWVKINDHEVGNLTEVVPRLHYEPDIKQHYFNYSIAGAASNRFTLDTDIPSHYYTTLRNIRVILCLNRLQLYVCAESQQQAEEIAWTIPWIYRPSSNLSMKIISPENGAHAVIGQPVKLAVQVDGTRGGEKYSKVRVSFNNSDQARLLLVDNGRFGDGGADDGVYATTWTADALGATKITFRASNCAKSTLYNRTIYVNKPEVYWENSGKDLSVLKTIKPTFLDTNAIRKEGSNTIKYTIMLCPKTALKDVKIVDSLPNYLSLNKSSLSRDAAIRINHDGRQWTTTTLTWDIGDLNKCKSITFEADFLWKVPADAQYVGAYPLPVSEVTYFNTTGIKGSVEIPEGEINLGEPNNPGEIPPNTPVGPSFEAITGILSLLGVVIILKRL